MNIDELNLSDPRILRLKAEELLKKNNQTSFANADTKKLMHELQIHQIELELQNEELTIANERAESALKKYTMLYDLAPIGYFILDADGTICDLNFGAADMLGERRFSLINSNFKLFISDNSKQVFNKFFSKIYTSNVKETCEVTLGYDNNISCDVYIEGIVTGDERKCLLSLVNILKFKPIH